LGWSWYAAPPPGLSLPDRDALDQARSFYAEVACTPYSFLSLMGDKYLLHRVDGRSLIQYGSIRQHLVALGDPACAPSNLPAAIHGFRRLADDYDRVPVFYQVREAHLHHYHEAGFRLLKLGESAQVELEAFRLEGKAGAKYRAVLNRAGRDGLAFEMLGQPLAEETWQQLQAVSDPGRRGTSACSSWSTSWVTASTTIRGCAPTRKSFAPRGAVCTWPTRGATPWRPSCWTSRR
jgi:phosphatidylglycerol lysyltransferase